MLAIFPVIAPAVLNDDQFSGGFQNVPVLGQTLRNGGVGHGLGADEDVVKAGGGEGAVIVRDGEVTGGKIQIAEQAGLVDTVRQNGVPGGPPGKEGDVGPRAAEHGGHGDANAAGAGNEKIHIGSLPISI